jgi:peptidoglycan/xylan/chitin deacetylase (PgdA/CDA1 family)/putative cell wall-binding protein
LWATVIAALLAVPAVAPALSQGGLDGALAVASSSEASVPVPAQTTPTTSRISGVDRYDTSVAISRHQFPYVSALRSVYLARGDRYADALAAGVLTDGPVLLVPSCDGVPTSVAAEISRITPDEVVALGGTSAVCDATLSQAAQGLPTARLAGTTRQGTAAAIAARAFPAGAASVYIVRGADNADALSAGMLTDGPVLLLDDGGLTVPDVTADAIASLNPVNVVAIGGSASVSTEALWTAGSGRTKVRVAGGDRYETATLVARRAYPGPVARVYLARGDGTNFADAVASGSLTQGPVLLAPGPCGTLSPAVRSYLFAEQPSRLTALGGTASLCSNILTQAKAAVSPPPPPPARPDCSRLACVALTFDDGPSAHTGRLLDTLDARNVPATFFVVGQQVDARPLTTRRAHNEGHSVENHTYSHPQLTTLTLAGQQSQVDRADSAIGRAGVPRSTQLRPPYGSWNSNTRRLGKPLILWSVDPRDWDGRTASQIRSHVSANTRSGAIVLMHDSVSATVDAVPGIITDLRARGYTLVLVEDLVPSMQPGDVVYSRSNVTRAATALAPQDVSILSPDGLELGPVVDEAPFVRQE